MAKTITIEIPEAEAKQVQNEISHLLEQINASQERTKAHQAQSARIGERTRATLDEIEKLLKRP